MYFATRNSTYEIDESGHRARRLRGAADPTPRMPDGEWREYIHVTGPKPGEKVIFIWKPSVEPPAVAGATPMTVTSVVQRVFDTLD